MVENNPEVADLVAVSVMQHRLRAIVEEMGWPATGHSLQSCDV